MTVSVFVRRFVLHTALALGMWLLAALTLEWLIPGFVTPFVNLPELVLIVLVLSAVSIVIVPAGRSRVAKSVSLVMLAIVLCAVCLFVWSRISELGGMGLLLTASAVLTCLLFMGSCWSFDDVT